ncbi:hypothetical protein [Spirillospora albida]|uniref:hypothetical protein n=1 Tax=Spirillospora albida TaxID=58123 RepID=UPI0004C14854|nr:hypothetical protein [Spirillospora albida]
MAYEATPDVRARMRRERKARGWDVQEMAPQLRNAANDPRAMPATRSLRRNIERWESGAVTRIQERYRILYARALSMSEEELFQPGDHTAPAPPPEAAEGDVDAIRTMLHALQTSDRQFGGRRIRQQASDYLSDVIEPRLRGPAPDHLRRSMFSVATEFTMRVSAMHLDSDHLDQAVSLLGRASSMAAETDDASLTAWVLSRRGEHEMHRAALSSSPTKQRACIDQAIAYTEGAAGVARVAPPMSRAFLTTKQALAWSMTGDRARTQRALGSVWDSYEHAGDGVQEPGWMGAYGWGHLQHEEARCYAQLGMGQHAVRAAQASLTVRTDLRPRAFSLGVLAIAHAQALDIDQACAVGRQLVGLASQISSRRVCIRVAEVLDALREYQSVPAVAELREAAQPVLEACGT